MATDTAKLATEVFLAETLSLTDLKNSRDVYNALPNGSAQPPVDHEDIQNLADLFVRCGAETSFGVHLIHAHFPIPENTIMLGRNFENPRGRWTTETNINNINLDDIHGHIYMLQDDKLLPYEFQDGPMPNQSGVSKDFIGRFADYVKKNNLTKRIGLQVLTGDMGCNMLELELHNGTVMLDQQKTIDCTIIRTTGWKFEVRDGKPRVCAANETHSETTSGTHKVFNVGKPLPRLDNVEDLKNALVQQGILVAA